MNVWLKEQVQNRKQAGLLALFLVILASGIITLCLVGASDARLFGRMRVVPTKAKASEEIPAAAGPMQTEAQSLSGKLSYEQFRSGELRYCGYLGRLNIHAAPDETTEILGHLVYKDPVQAFFQEQNGYVKICADRTDGALEGYCLKEELTPEEPSDGRIFLNVPDYKQYDPRWGGLSLGGSYETIESAGCTTTCLAMAYTYLEGQETTPDAMMERLWYNEQGMLGFPKIYTRYDGGDYLDVILQKLQAGIPVLVGGKNENGGQHWVLAVGYQGDGSQLNTGDFLINDPNSSERPTLAEFFADYPQFNKIAYKEN